MVGVFIRCQLFCITEANAKGLETQPAATPKQKIEKNQNPRDNYSPNCYSFAFRSLVHSLVSFVASPTGNKRPAT